MGTRRIHARDEVLTGVINTMEPNSGVAYVRLCYSMPFARLAESTPPNEATEKELTPEEMNAQLAQAVSDAVFLRVADPLTVIALLLEQGPRVAVDRSEDEYVMQTGLRSKLTDLVEESRGVALWKSASNKLGPLIRNDDSAVRNRLRHSIRLAMFLRVGDALALASHLFHENANTDRCARPIHFHHSPRDISHSLPLQGASRSVGRHDPR